GRPDTWRHFDVRGQVTEVDVDTNFDGRPDVEEYYQRGVLVRRESDRNFNGQADLIEEFDAETHHQTRSVVDVDFDGTADLLVLFRDGRPVYSKRTSSTPSDGTQPATRQKDGNHLASLIDPFESDLAVRAVHVRPADEVCVGCSTSGSLPSARAAPIGRPSASARLALPTDFLDARTLLLPRSPRAPPLV